MNFFTVYDTEWHVNTAEAENLNGRSISPPLILSR